MPSIQLLSSRISGSTSQGVSGPGVRASLWDGSKLFSRPCWLVGIQQGDTCVSIAAVPLVGVGECVRFTLRLGTEARGRLLCGQLCSRGPGAGGGWGGRAVPCGALEGPVRVHLWVDEGPGGILQKMPIHHGVLDDRVYVVLTVLLNFLKLFWLHRQLGLDIAVVDTYGRALVCLLLPILFHQAKDESKGEQQEGATSHGSDEDDRQVHGPWGK